MADLIYLLTHSTDNPDRATTGLATALAAQRAGHDVVLWLTGEGVRLGVRQVAETLREPGPETAAEMVEALAAGGAVL
jgi:predicted peroxiredoxin